MEVAADLPLPETTLRGVLEEADRVHLPVEIERRLGIEVLGFSPVPRRGRSTWSLLRLRSCGCGYGTVVWRRRLSPPALALRCRHALASRASGGSRPWSRRGFDARAMEWHAVSGGRAAPSFAELYRTAFVAPVAAPHHDTESRTRAAQDSGMRGNRQRPSGWSFSALGSLARLNHSDALGSPHHGGCSRPGVATQETAMTVTDETAT